MPHPDRYLRPAEAAAHLKVSAKALRLYEQRGLVTPARTAAGWRAYGPKEMARAAEVAALRALGLSLAQIARVLDGDASNLDHALADHQMAIEARLRALAGTMADVRDLRAGIAQGRSPSVADLARLTGTVGEVSVAFDLPWPWGGERFELRGVRALTYIVGPLGSGKTRFARRLAETLPDATFLGLDRSADPVADAVVQAAVAATLAWLVEDGATVSDALLALLAGLQSDGPVVVDMVEHGLDQPTQEALIANLRRRPPGANPLFLMTRSSAILDLAAVGPDEAIILCPANHSPPTVVAPYPGAPGYEAVATCLASPDVRARTEGVIARRPEVA